MALALVDGEMNDLDLGTELFEARVAAVRGTVGDGDDLEGDLPVAQERDHLGDMADEVRTRVVVGHDHRQLKLALGSHEGNCPMPKGGRRAGGGGSENCSGAVQRQFN